MWQMDYDSAAQYWVEKDKLSKKMGKDQLKEKIADFIKANKTCALATASSSGDFVRCTPIEYNYLDDCFYLFSEGGLKFKGLKDNKNVALAIYGAYEGFGKLKSLQVCGTASLIEPFCDEYLKVMAFRKIPVEMMKKLPKPMNLIKIEPETYDFLDSDLKKDGFDSRQHLDA